MSSDFSYKLVLTGEYSANTQTAKERFSTTSSSGQTTPNKSTHTKTN